MRTNGHQSPRFLFTMRKTRSSVHLELQGIVSEVQGSCFRNEDVVVRWGGDEFIIVLPNTNEKDTNDIVGRICQSCENKSKLRLPVSVAIGTAFKKKVSQDIDMIVNRAEKRMFMNKRAMKAAL